MTRKGKEAIKLQGKVGIVKDGGFNKVLVVMRKVADVMRYGSWVSKASG